MVNIMNDEKNPYIKNGQPYLQESIVAFVDILGYKEYCRDDEPQKKLEELHKKLSKSFYRLDGLRDDGEPFFPEWPCNQRNFHKIRTFSDNIVIGYPIIQLSRGLEEESRLEEEYSKGLIEFKIVLFNIALFQFEMAIQGFFVRGAISVGELYMDDLIVFGQALLDAYEAESKEAVNPRIILTESAQEIIEKHDKLARERMIEKDDNNCDDQPRSEYMNSLYQDADGKLFINYLDSLLIGEDRLQFVHEFVTHKKMIEEKLRKHHSQPACWAKYAWVANYHNYFCGQHFDDEYKVGLAQYQMQITRIKEKKANDPPIRCNYRTRY